MSSDETAEVYETLLREAISYRGPRIPGLARAVQGVQKSLNRLNQINRVNSPQP